MGDNSLTSSPGGGDEKSSKEIRFEGGAPGDARKGPRWRKLPSWLPLIPLGLCTSFGVSGYSPATMQIEKHYGVSQEIGVLKRRLQEDGGNIPEARLRMSRIAAIVHPISLFWFAWTTHKSVNPAVPVLATALLGCSFYTLILMTYQYMEDAYKQYSASALAGLGLIWNLAGAGLPFFGYQMFENAEY